MVMVNIEYPEKGCSTPCKAMRCQKCVLHDSTSVFEYLAKDREKDKPDWCPIKWNAMYAKNCLYLTSSVNDERIVFKNPVVISNEEVKDLDEFGNYT